VQEERGRLWAKEQDLKYREAVIDAAKIDNGADPQELADTKKQLDTARTQVATHETTIATLTQQLQNNNVDTTVDENCPFVGCNIDIRTMTRQALVAHFKIHGGEYTTLQAERIQCGTSLTDSENVRSSLADQLQKSKGALDRATHDLDAANKALEAAKATGGQDTALTGLCPFPGCTEDLAPLTRQTLRDHFANNHADSFTCNLPVCDTGRRCATVVQLATPEDHLQHLDAFDQNTDTGPQDDENAGLQTALDHKFHELTKKLATRKAADPTKVYNTQTPRPRPGETPAAFQARVGTAPVPPTIEEKIRKRPGETAIDRDTRVRAANIDWVLRTQAKEFVCTRANFDTFMHGVIMPPNPDWDQRIHDADFRQYNRLRQAENPPLPTDDGSSEPITVFGFPSLPSSMKQPRKVRGTRATSATPAHTTKRKRVASTTPGLDLGPAPKTPKRAPGRPRRKAAVEEEDEEEFVTRDDEESEVPLTSPSKRVTRRSPSKRG
jgi:hypothetical protein